MTKIVHIRRFPVKGGFYAINLFSIIFTIQELIGIGTTTDKNNSSSIKYEYFYELKTIAPHCNIGERYLAMR